MLTENRSEMLAGSASARGSTGPESPRSRTGKNAKKRAAEEQPSQSETDLSTGDQRDRTPGTGEESQSGPEGDMDGFPRPADRRAQEFLPQWLRRLGRG